MDFGIGHFDAVGVITSKYTGTSAHIITYKNVIYIKIVIIQMKWPLCAIRLQTQIYF